MQNVSDEVKALLAQYAKIALSVYVDGEKIDAGIGSFTLSSSCGSEDEFSFGNACATSLSMVVADVFRNLEGSRLQVKWSVNGPEHPLFTGKAKNASVSGGRTTIEAWDDMFYGGSDAFVPSMELQSDVEASTAFEAVAIAMGVDVDPGALEMLSGIVIHGGIAHLPSETSNSAVAGYIAGLIGGNAWISRSGQLTIRQYTSIDFETEPYSGGASTKGREYAVTGITLQREYTVSKIQEDGTSVEEGEVYEFGAGDGTLMVSNPLADQDAADRCFAILGDLVLQPGSYSFPGGLLLEPGDIFTLHSMDGSYTVAAVSLSMSFDGGVKTTVSCGGEPDRGGAAGQLNQALATLIADYARLRTLVAENASIVNAKITNLRVDDIVAGRIRSTDFESINLQQIYPESNIYPFDQIFPNNGEEIVRGLEIDFAKGEIRGVFFNQVTDQLEQRINDIERRLAALE